jgi:hypothetical protein
VAIGLNRVLEYLKPLLSPLKTGKVLLMLIPAAFFINTFSLGPLVDIYATANNFTNHFAFQGSYTPHQWDTSKPQAFKPGYAMQKSKIPEFYFRLSREASTFQIVEYPLPIGDTFNLFYYYQHFHEKKMMAGYLKILPRQKTVNFDFVFGIYPIDYVMSRLKDGKYRFQNMIDMTNVERIRNENIRYLIVHKNILAEMAPYLAQNKYRIDPAAQFLRDFYAHHFSEPDYEDEKIFVVEVK